jgi:hypothetical protein
MTNELPESRCHRKREHVPHVRYEAQTPVAYCPGVGDLFPADRLSEPADPFEGIDEAYGSSDW